MIAMAAAPRVSVVVTCHDLGRFLDEAVGSVLAQTLAGVETIVVDDGSTDADTLAVLDRIAHPGVRVLRLPHGGLAAARNAGLAAARGDYVCALDADDRLRPEYLEKAAAVLDTDPSAAFVSPWLRTFGDEQWDWTPERCDLPALLAECTVCTAALARRQALLAAGGWDTGMPAQGYEDWELWLTLVERGFDGRILPEVLFDYRIRPGSMSAGCTRGPAHAALRRYMFDKHEASFRAHFFEVWRERDGAIADLLHDNDERQLELAQQLAPEVALRRRELARLEDRLRQAREGGPRASDAPAVRRELAAQRAAWTEARREIAALRESWSWRLTAPLRAGLDLLRSAIEQFRGARRGTKR
ncbi:MAG TPA: glycosyltransferase [Thermoanaerobaculia bacterium]|jgi:glycosyltransferase involved in cell wall biosynthesis|nr:glycosyltransferase [Thermoanaerobaculia bacterium]